MEEIDRKELADVKTQVARLQVEFESFSRDIGEIKKLLESFRTPKATNWLGIAALVVAVLVPAGSFAWLIANMRLSPIEERYRTLAQSQEKIDSTLKRDLEWNYANQALHHEHTSQMMNKLFDRVFGADAPRFQEKQKP